MLMPWRVLVLVLALVLGTGAAGAGAPRRRLAAAHHPADSRVRHA